MTKSDPRQTLQPFVARAGLEGSTLQVGLDSQWKQLEAHRQRQSRVASPSQPLPNGNGHTDRFRRLLAVAFRGSGRAPSSGA
jgi:hypothetical protein